MLIKITDPATQTVIFSAIFLFLLIASVRKSQNRGFFPKEVTEQLKVLAILAIIFSHTGYFLYSDQRFLYPLSALGGVGVNLFLFLSGFGLTLSHLKNNLSPLRFYLKRLLKLFIPLWIVISILLLTDLFVLHRAYPLEEIIRSFLGFYPKADVWQNLDSPLWYFSIILFYYLIFPFIFIKKAPFVSAGLIFAVSFLLLNQPLPVNKDVLVLYKLHTMAFPLGILFGWAVLNIKIKLSTPLKLLILIAAFIFFLYTSVNSYVGQGLKIEQSISLITTLSLVAIFAILPVQFKLLSIFGLFSYEIYLFHWPILSRYNLFSFLPSFLMVILNLVLFIALALLTKKNYSVQNGNKNPIDCKGN